MSGYMVVLYKLTRSTLYVLRTISGMLNVMRTWWYVPFLLTRQNIRQ